MSFMWSRYVHMDIVITQEFLYVLLYSTTYTQVRNEADTQQKPSKGDPTMLGVPTSTNINLSGTQVLLDKVPGNHILVPGHKVPFSMHEL